MILETIFAYELIFLITATADGMYKREMIRRWRAGSLQMKELLWLKRQDWFSRQFTKVEVDSLKKHN